MATEYTGGGDPKRTLELLWGVPTGPRRGPKPRLGIEQIAAAAIELADAEGLPALTMRAVADRLGVAPMTLYTYVPTKAELMDVMVDTVFRELPLPDLADRPWRERVETVARDNRALFDRHPWLTQVSAVRPPLGPGVLAKYEHELRAFEGLGLGDVEMDLALSHVLAFVQASARGSAEAQASQAVLADEQWWAEVAPLLEKVFDPERYPTAARVGQASGEEYNAAYSPDRVYEFGLARVLDGLAALIDARRTDGR